MKKTTPDITLPANKGPDYGLCFSRNRWHARYYKNGKLHMKSCGTIVLEEARAHRDEIYREMIAKGATQAGTPEHMAKHQDRYIYTQPPFIVRIKGKNIGYFHTREEARVARDKAIGLMMEISEPFTI